MKRTQWMIAVMLAVLIGLPIVYAQSTNVVMQVPATTSVNGAVRVTIPFDFSVSGKSLKAGEYLIAPADEKGISFKGSNGSAVALTNGISSNKADGPKLVFHKYGHTYFLAQTWLRNSESGRELFVSPQEINMAREYKQEQVVLVAKK